MNEAFLSLGTLTYLYVGTSDFERDLAFYRETLGAEKVWHFAHFGARVAALRLGEGPLFLLADHRPAPSCLLLYAVENLEATARDLRARGWKPDGEKFELPDGPCYTFHDPSGNPLAIFQIARPNAMPNSYADPANKHAVRD